MRYRMEGIRDVVKSRKQKYIKVVLKAYRRTWIHLAVKGWANKWGIECEENAFLHGYWPSQPVYKIIKKYFPAHLVPIASEAFNMTNSICFEGQYANILRFAMFDDLPYCSDENLCHVAQKHFLCVLAEGEAVREEYEGGSYEFMGQAFPRISNIDTAHYCRILKTIRDSWDGYFAQVVFPMIKEIHRRGICGPIFGAGLDITCEMVLYYLPLDGDLDEEAVRFIVEDALFYVCGANCSSYNPFWIFGSEHYEEMLQKIWTLPDENEMNEGEEG